MNVQFDKNLILLWGFICLQVLLGVSYFVFAPPWGPTNKAEPLPFPVKFVSNSDQNLLTKLGLDKFKTYYNAEVDEEIYLRSEHIEEFFLLINDTTCYKYGTDLGYMERNKDTRDSSKCECLPDYHGNDCSLPEVMWRAFIAARQAIITKRGHLVRRLILMVHVAHPAQLRHLHVLISSLAEVVDLFVVSESNVTEFGGAKPFYVQQKLDKGLLRSLQYKILFSPVRVRRNDLKHTYRTVSELAWEKTLGIIKNVRDDDVLMYFDSSEVPCPKALLFFKLFDGYSLPVHFRLKWNVFGYFYQHPNKTRTVTTGATVRTLAEVYKNNPSLMSEGVKGLTIGDLNRMGGWFCDLCFDPNDILNIIQSLTEFEDALADNNNVVDVKYLEQLIADGKYIDGKTILLRTTHQHENYAPIFVTNNTWKFDALLTNYYNKIDYN